MGLGKQAKTLTKTQVDAILGYLSNTRHPARNRVILLLSVKAGLRAKEIARLTWDMVTTSTGEIGNPHPPHQRGQQGQGGRPVIRLNKELRSALLDLRRSPSRGRPSPFVIATERSAQTSPQAIVNLFSGWYPRPRLPGCSSHSGDGPSSPTPLERSRRSAGRCGTSRRWPATRTYRRPSAT